MLRTFAVITFVATITGPVAAQNVHSAAASTKAISKQDPHKTSYWLSRDLSSVLTKAVTIKLH